MMAVGVTGQRPKTLGLQTFRPQDELWARAYDRVAARLNDIKPTMVIAGGAIGFDMIASKAAIDNGYGLELALPYPGYDESWSQKNRDRMTWLADRCTFVHYISEGPYKPELYHKRNEFIVDHSELLIAFWNGKPGCGTKSTINYATGKIPWEVIEP